MSEKVYECYKCGVTLATSLKNGGRCFGCGTMACHRHLRRSAEDYHIYCMDCARESGATLPVGKASSRLILAIRSVPARLF